MPTPVVQPMGQPMVQPMVQPMGQPMAQPPMAQPPMAQPPMDGSQQPVMVQQAPYPVVYAVNPNPQYPQKTSRELEIENW